MANEKRAKQKFFLVDLKRQQKKDPNVQLEMLARRVLDMAIRVGRKDIAKSVQTLLHTIEQTGISKDVEHKKMLWLNNFMRHMTK